MTSLPIHDLMVNRNGLRIARETRFAAQLIDGQPGLEITLQLDSLRDEAVTRQSFP